MKAIELENKLHEYNTGKYASLNNEVMLCLDPDIDSWGPSPSIPIVTVNKGIDWDQGLVLLGTNRPVILKEKNRDIPRKVIQIFYKDNARTPTLHCPCCEALVQPNDRYCHECGQRLDVTNPKNVEI